MVRSFIFWSFESNNSSRDNTLAAAVLLAVLTGCSDPAEQQPVSPAAAGPVTSGTVTSGGTGSSTTSVASAGVTGTTTSAGTTTSTTGFGTTGAFTTGAGTSTTGFASSTATTGVATSTSGGMGAGGTGSGSTGQGATDGATTGGMSIEASFDTLKFVIENMQPSCAAADCHGNNEFNNLNLVVGDELYSNLTTTTSEACGNVPVVNPGNPAQSALVMLLKGPCGELERMPRGCIENEFENNCVPEQYIQAIEQWIANGAPEQ